MNAQNLRIFAILSVFCLSLLLLPHAATSGSQVPSLKELMQKRLDYMGDLLSGLAIDDWTRIERGAEGLVGTCEAMDWSGPGKEEFKRRDAAFCASAEAVLRNVRKKNLADIQRSFIQATISCWGCHDYPAPKE